MMTTICHLRRFTRWRDLERIVLHSLMQRRQKLSHSFLVTDMYRISVSWFNANSVTYGGYCVPRERWPCQEDSNSKLSLKLFHIHVELHFMSYLSDSLLCIHILEHNCYDPVEPLYYMYVAGSILSVSIVVLRRFKTGTHPKAIHFVTAVKTKIPSVASSLLTVVSSICSSWFVYFSVCTVYVQDKYIMYFCVSLAFWCVHDCIILTSSM